ncbi:MAG: hypothetical protein U0169_09780 [Polyangiaceae bacterium]
MRVTESIRSSFARDAQADAAEALQRRARVASSGLRVGAPSDDPAAFAAKMRMDDRLGRIDSRATSATRAGDMLQLAEGALASASDVLVSARELATRMSSGSVDAATRKSAAAEIRSHKAALVGIANTRGPSGYVFSGSNTTTAPFATSGAFTGNDDVARVEIADGVFVIGNASGARAFTATGGRDVFADLDALATALDTDDVSAIRTSLGNLESDHAQIVSSRITVGTQAGRLTSAADALGSTKVALSRARASEVESDPAEAYSALVEAQAAYERNIAVTKRLLEISAIER